ncbi:MAG TPA: TRIC cation channel family protein [Aeromicrobium sp.]|nr:TRIC cation channel family protein [Aeromicrobium sp.]
MTGALVGVRKQLDLYGVAVLAMITGLGGGVLRDVLIDAVPPTSVEDWRYLLVPVLAGALVFYFPPPSVGWRSRSSYSMHWGWACSASPVPSRHQSTVSASFRPR